MTTRLGAALALVLTLALGACGPPDPVVPGAKEAPSPTAHSYAPDAVVLRITHEGGPPGPGPAWPRLPVWSLYGDGRVMTQGPVPLIYPGPALPNVQVERVSTATVSRIAREARAAGVDGQPRDEPPPVADATQVMIRLSDEQGTAEARIYTLSHKAERQPDGDPRLHELYEHLTDLDGWLGAGTVVERESYEPGTIGVYARPYDPETARAKPEAQRAVWEGADPGAGEQTPVGRCTLVTGAALAKALPAFRKANELTRWTYGGKEFRFDLRPLLPEERTCADAVA